MRAIFLDRDGVINKYPGDTKYVTNWKKFRFLPRAKKAIAKLHQNGFKIFVVSNQAGVSKGIYSQKTLDFITKNMRSAIRKAKGEINEVYYCIHRKEQNCPCRKPKAGLIERAKAKYSINLKQTFFIGDTIRDIETGKRAGLKTILVFSGKEKPENKNSWQVLPDFTACDLREAVNLVLRK